MSVLKPLDAERRLLLAALCERLDRTPEELRTIGVTDIVERSLTSTWNSCLAHTRKQLESIVPRSISGLFTRPDLYDEGDRRTPVIDVEHIERLANQSRPRK